MNDVVAKETLFPWQQEYSRIFCSLQSGEVHIWYTRETKIHQLSCCNGNLYYLVTVWLMFLFAVFVP